MTTQMVPLDIVEAESEFDIPCNMLIDGGCDAPAEWMVWCTHTVTEGCPGTVYSCTHCKEACTQVIADMLTEISNGATSFCNHCSGYLSGQLSDNLRFMKL